MVKSKTTKIDLSSYRTSEFVDRVVELLSLPSAVQRILKSGAYGLIAAITLAFLFLAATNKFSIGWAIFFGAYAIPAGIIGGLASGIASFIHRSLEHMVKLVDLLFENTKKISADLRSVSDGEKSLPSARDLVNETYNQILLQTIKEVLNKNFGLFGSPIFFVYRLTLNQFVRQAIKLIPKTDEDIHEAEDVISTTTNAVTNHEDKLIARLSWAQTRLGAITGSAKKLVIAPCYAILVAVFCLLLIPVLFVWHFFM